MTKAKSLTITTIFATLFFGVLFALYTTAPALRFYLLATFAIPGYGLLIYGFWGWLTATPGQHEEEPQKEEPKKKEPAEAYDWKKDEGEITDAYLVTEAIPLPSSKK